MNSRRVTLLLIAGLLVIGFAIWVSSKRHLEHATLAGDPVLPGLESALNSISEVRLIKAGGVQTSLKKGATAWTVAERDYPADSGKVRKLLLDLASLNVVEDKTRTPELYPQLGVEDVSSTKATGTRVEAVTPARTYALIVGKASSGKSGFVRVASSPQSLLAAPLVTLETDPARWLDHTLLDIPQERVKEITVKPAEGPAYTATRATKDQQDFTVSGLPKGRELSSPTAADPIAGSLAGLTLDDVQRAGASASGSSTAATKTVGSPASSASAAPSAPAHVTFRTFDGLEVELTGHKDGTRNFIAVVARSSDKQTQGEADTIDARVRGWEFEVPSYKYDGMFRPLDELLKKPPEPAKNAKTAAKTDATSEKGKAKGGKPKKDSAPPAAERSSPDQDQR